MDFTTTHRIGSLPVPALALGTMYFGTTVSTDSAFACLDTAADLGATFWDTANNYAFWAGGTGDESETVVGDWFAARGQAAREQVTLASKVGARPVPGHADLDHVQGLSAPAVREQVTGSLRRLRTDRLDLLYAHVDDTSVPLEETLGVLGELVDEGLVREVGASNLTADRLRDAVAVAPTHPYRALQQRFTYLPTAPGADTGPQVVLDAGTEEVASAAEVTLAGYSPLLSGAYTRDDRPLPTEYGTPRSRRLLEELRAVADEVGLDAGQVVLSWMTRRDTPVLPVVGVSRPEQVGSAWAAVTHPLPRETVVRLDDLRS